jgi:hypothetical protein
MEAASFQERLEAGNDALDKVSHLMDCFEQRLRLNDLRLIQRYVESKLEFLIHFESAASMRVRRY